jgi:hypothetical protein
MAGNIFKKKVTGFINLLLLLSLTISAFRCDQEKDPEFVFMIFVLPISIELSSEEIILGDTLWISGGFPDTLQEYYSKKYYKLSDFNFKSKICLDKLINSDLYLSQQPGATSDFNIINELGSFSGLGSSCGTFDFQYQFEMYHYKIGLVTKSTGVFSAFFLWPIDLHGLPEEQVDLRPVIDLGKTSDGRNRIPVYEAFFFLINDGQTNFELFVQNCRAGSLENPEDFKNVFAEQKGTFTFRVIE